MKKETKPKEVYAETLQKESIPVDFKIVADLIKSKGISGWIQRQGKLSDGKTFCQVYLVIDK